MLKKLCFLSIVLTLCNATTIIFASTKNTTKIVKTTQKAARQQKRLSSSNQELQNAQVPLRRDFDSKQTNNPQDYFTGR